MAEKDKDSAGEAMRHNGTSSKMVGGSEDDEQIQTSTSVGQVHCEEPAAAAVLITHFEKAASEKEKKEEAPQSKQQEQMRKSFVADEAARKTKDEDKVLFYWFNCQTESGLNFNYFARTK